MRQFKLLMWLTALQPVAMQTDNVIQATDSDYFFLYQMKSSIPLDIGAGVYSKIDILPNEIICEYRGPIIDHTIPYYSNKKFQTVGGDGKQYTIIGDTICSMINDPVLIVGNNYTAEEIEYFKSSPDFDVIPTYPGLTYNAKHTTTAMGKVFIYSTTLIPANTEIFFPYGK